MKKLTVAIPVYNGEDFISEALESIVGEPVDNILVCDNGSTDNTLKIVEGFAKEHPEFDVSIYVNKTNIGSDENHNKCIELCETSYLRFLHADDLLIPDTLKCQLESFKNHPHVGLIGGQVDIIDEYGNFRGNPAKDYVEYFKKGHVLEFVKSTNLWISPSTVMLNLTKMVGLINVDGIGADERYWLSILRSHPIAVLSIPVAKQRVHTSQGGMKEHLRYKDKIKHFELNLEKIREAELGPRRREAVKLTKQWIARQCIGISKSVKKNFGEKALSRKYWFYGFKTAPIYYMKYYYTIYL